MNLQSNTPETEPPHAEDAVTVEHLRTQLAELEAALERARGERDAAERLRHNTVARVGELRRALDSVGVDTTTARAQARDLGQRYAQALDGLRLARRRMPAAALKRAMRRLVGRKRRIRHEDDLFTLNASIYFDARWYLETYPDVREQQVDPALHFLLYGAAERRDPGPWFSTEQYLVNNPDVAAAGVNALLHYVRHGEAEGRNAQAAPTMSLAREWTAGQRLSCIYITGEPESPGHRYRVLDFLDAAGINDIPATWLRADDLAGNQDEIVRHDVAIFWRVAWTQEVARTVVRLRQAGRKIVFDIDDLMTEPDLARLSTVDGIRTQSLSEEGVRSHYERVRRMMLESDLCLATTEELAFHLRVAGKTTYVISNGFTRATLNRSRAAVRRRRAGPADDLVRIGYAGGSRTHQRDFATCAAAVAQMLREDPRCRLVLFRTPGGPLLDPAEFPELGGMEAQIEWRDAVPLADLPLELARFDINLAPLEFGNPYCEAKSELKVFEAALVDVPTIASPTGPFRRAIEHGKTGMLAASADDWLVELRRLVEDAQMRATLGRAAYRATLGRFGPETKALRFGNVVEQWRGGVAGARAFAHDARLMHRRPPAPGVYPSETVFERDMLGEADVTVVVPLYNYEGFIEETLDSVAGQTAPSLDLIVVDGHSTDDSLAVARRWIERHADRFNRVLLLQNSANYGLGFCRNSGIDAAETRYVILLDADNKLMPEACEALAAHADTTGAAFVYPSIQQFGASTLLAGATPYDPQRLAAGNYIDALALVSKEAWAIAGGVDHVRHGWEDYDFWCRMAELGLRGVWLDRPLALYRVHGASMQTSQTQIPENYRRLLETFKARHPWVSLHDQERSRRLPARRDALTGTSERSRIDALLPILRCPLTGEKLGLGIDRETLHSFDGLRTWPVSAGRPVMTLDGMTPVLHPEEHQSNALPGMALDLIRESQGWVLNLSAGGTAQKYDNVIEAEIAIFRNTDIVADAHALPFDDAVFDAAIVLNAFEHYRDPQQVVAELHRVLKPRGKLLVVTAFMQPLHEKPWHFFNCTRYGLEAWFKDFQDQTVHVGGYVSPSFSIGWMASEIEAALRHELGDAAAITFLESRVGDFVGAFRDPALREQPAWIDLSRLSQAAQEITAAGFEFAGRKGDGIPIYVK